MSRLRVLVLAPGSSPEQVSMPYVTFSHAAALAQLHDVTLVITSSTEDPVRRAKAPFHAIEVVQTQLIERFHYWCFQRLLKGNYDSQAATALAYPFGLAFEWFAWRQLRDRIVAGKFDVVLRVMPMTPVLPSPFAFLLRKGPIPFVIGPLNGGLPWPSGFSQLENQKEWVANFRNLYRYLPFSRATYRYAAAIIAASSQTYSEFQTYRHKLFFVPEPGIARSLCHDDSRKLDRQVPLELIFVGGLVPRKACDLALRASAALLRKGLARFTVVGDGPDRDSLEQLAKSLDIEKAVLFCGWLSHTEVLTHLRSADVLVFPSLRDNGAGVVFEALGTGAVPIVVDFGGPGDIVRHDVGYKVPLTNVDDIVAQMEKALSELEGNREKLLQLRQQGIAYVRDCLTWDAKAKSVSQVLEWVVQRGQKPDLLPPKFLQ